MRMNISVPDALAEQVRERNLPISVICQQALREELRRLKAIEAASDIPIYIASQQADPDPLMWPGFDPGRPHLVYGHHPELGDGWTLWHQLGGELNDHFIPGGPNSAEWALRQSRGWLRLVNGDNETKEMAEITVEVGEPSLTIGFTGRWLLEPDDDDTRTGEDGHDAGAYWGIALTKRGRIAVYTAHCNYRWPASLNDYDSLDRAADGGVPADIIARAAGELGETRVLWRDI